MDVVVRAQRVRTIQMAAVVRRVALLLLAFCAPCEAMASVFDDDDRQTGITTTWPVGVVGEEWFGYGSGFLIDQCTVLTARHVLGGGKAVGKRKRFRLQPWLPRTDDNSSRGTVIDAGDAALGQAEDWALIRLDKCLGERFGFFPVVRNGFYTLGGSARLQPGLIAMGFPADRGRHSLSVDPQCEARLRTTRGLLHDCASMPGASGGPLLIWNKTSRRYEAIGIIVAGFSSNKPASFRLDRANVGVDLTVPRDAISGRVPRRPGG